MKQAQDDLSHNWSKIETKLTRERGAGGEIGDETREQRRS